MVPTQVAGFRNSDSVQVVTNLTWPEQKRNREKAKSEEISALKVIIKVNFWIYQEIQIVGLM